MGTVAPKVKAVKHQRLQLAVYPDDVREWRLVDRWPNKAATERVNWVIEQFDQSPDGRHPIRR